MLAENISYLITFIITTGIAVIGVLTTYNLFQAQKNQVLQILLYHQIFLFSFFIYGIWGNIAINEIISDMSLSAELIGKLTLFVPVIGTPFLIVSWFMLHKFGFAISGYKLSRTVVFSFFTFFFVVVFGFAFLVQNNIIKIPLRPEIFTVRALIFLNLGVHFILLYPVFRPAKKSIFDRNRTHFQNIFLLYFAGTALYSILLFYHTLFGFISTCISIIILFGASVLIPVLIYFKQRILFKNEQADNIDFEAFCKLYEISKREAEIILEICSGKTNKAIAEKLFITLQTVKDHNHRIYTKTQVRSRVQLTNLVREKTGGVPMVLPG